VVTVSQLYRCNRCQQEVDTFSQRCPRCGRFNTLGPYDMVEEALPTAAEPCLSTPLDAQPMVQPTWTCSRCQRANHDARRDCVECASPRNEAGSRAISGDAGSHSLAPGDILLVGRDPLSPAAVPLARFGNVSRHHLSLTVSTDGEVTLTDLYSRNGTWLVEGTGLRRLPRGVPVVVAPEAIVQLGNKPGAENARFRFVK
jgi:DNA-directed RNA polymerase subunit RPC12/RpoP